MAEHDERWMLSHLIEMCKDDELVLRYSASHVQDPTVKTVLQELASQRARFAADLLPHMQRLGATDAPNGTTRGALHRGWVAVKATLKRADDKAMLAEAEQAEAHILAAYQEALDDLLPITARDVVERQYAEIRRAQDQVHSLLSH